MQPGHCRINAEYCQDNGPLPSSSNNTSDNGTSKPKFCVVHPTLGQLSTLVWDKSQITNTAGLVIPELPSAEYITDLRIDMTVSDDVFNEQAMPNILLPHTPTATFTRLKCLILVGLAGKFSLVPLRWDVSCPALEELWLQDSHSVNDVRAILQGCPKLKKLIVSTITDALGLLSGEIHHLTLRSLTLVSNVPVAPMLKVLTFSELERLDLWVMPGRACDTTFTTTLFESLMHIADGKRWTLGLNFDVAQDIIADHFSDRDDIVVTRLT